MHGRPSVPLIVIGKRSRTRSTTRLSVDCIPDLELQLHRLIELRGQVRVRDHA
jgi:hypothetical protein